MVTRKQNQPDWSGEAREQMVALSDLADVVSRELSGAIGLLATTVRETLDSGRKLLLCGNGGSAADAQHIAAEYVVRFSKERAALPAIALTTDSSILTAEGNDHGFESIFSRQIEALGAAGDLLLLHSTSGESENLLRAADTARTRGLRTAALLAKGGGRLKDRVDLALVVPTEVTARAQEIHITIEHIVCDIVDREV